MAKFVVYPTPLSAKVTLSPDGAGTIQLTGYTAPDGREGQSCEVAESIPSGHGAEIVLEANGFQRMRLRGFLVHDASVARLQVDDYVLTEAAAPTPPDPGPTPPSGPRTPLQIIDAVYASTHPNLATAAGCGKFTEDCCEALHLEHSTMWGHIAKDPGQNQYNGHAVDAVMLLTNVSNDSGFTQAGIYDIIFSSASADAKPVFNYVEPPAYEKWYYPADAPTRGVVMFALPALNPRR